MIIFPSIGYHSHVSTERLSKMSFSEEKQHAREVINDGLRECSAIIYDYNLIL